MPAETKYQSRERRAVVREILRKEWDPIGVFGSTGAEDEYASYVGEVSLMLFEERATAETIATHLLRIATEWMGLSLSSHLSSRCTHAANTLVALRPRLDSH